MSIAHTLSVVGQDVGIHLPIRKALIALERSYLNDTFITIPNFKQEILEIENNQFSIQLLKNTYGSFYRLVLLGDMDTELLNCFIIMPDQDCNLQDLSLLTAYPEIEISITATSFLQLSDVPKSYIGQAGKVLAVKQDESGLEFIECTCNDDGVTPPLISCFGATNVMSFSHITGDFDIFVDDMETPVISDSIGPAMYQLNNLYHGKLEGSYDSFLYMANNDSVPHRLKFIPKLNSGASFVANTEDNPTFVADDNGGFYFCLGQQKALISCDGATSLFVATTDFNGSLTMEVSINGGDWVSIFAAQELSVLHYPQYLGVSLKVYISHSIEVARVQMRCSSDICLYVNPVANINEIEQENQTYILYDSQGNVVDPRQPSNHVKGELSIGNDPSTDEDYAVYFRSAHFCLVASAPPLISCDGATNSVVFEEDPDFTSWGSIDSIVINDTEYAKPDGIPDGELLPLNPTPDGDQIRISIGGGHPYQKLMFENLGARPARVKLKTKQDWSGNNLANANLHSSNDNPTVVGDSENFEVRFCLAILS